MFYSRLDRVAPRVIRTAEEEALVNLAVWEQIPPPAGTPRLEEGEFPRLMYNINAPPVVVSNAEEVAALGSNFRVYQIPQAIIDVIKSSEPDVPAVTIDPASAEVPAAGSSGSFTVTITAPGTSGTWTADKDAAADWLTIDSPTAPQSADGAVDYTAAANLGAARSAAIYVNGKTFTVNQAAAA